MSEPKPTVDFDHSPLVASQEYDKRARMVIPGYDALYTMVLSIFRSQLPEAANLLVVGAGTGMELITLSKSNPSWQILGVDPSSSMLKIAQQKIEQYNLSENIKLQQGYTQDLPTNLLYDGATCILVMHFVPDEDDKLALLQAISQRLKSSATLVLVDLFGKKDTESFKRLASVLQEYLKEMGMPSEMRLELIETINERIYPIPEDKIFELLQQAGFSKITRFYTGLWYGGWLAVKE